jgi:ABC-type nitrate/sulfonate/bicarbonate transport system permease component
VREYRVMRCRGARDGMTHGIEPAPLPRRSRLARDVAIVIAVKLLALVAIKLAWFSEPPTPPPSEVARTLFDSKDRGQARHEARE